MASYFYEPAYTPLIYLISVVIIALGAAVSIAVVYFPLRALAHILRILMEMEFRSRKAIYKSSQKHPVTLSAAKSLPAD